jgi:hypothetical protein
MIVVPVQYCNEIPFDDFSIKTLLQWGTMLQQVDAYERLWDDSSMGLELKYVLGLELTARFAYSRHHLPPVIHC